MTWQYHL